MKCPKCGSDMELQTVTAKAFVWTWRCLACGHIETKKTETEEDSE